LYIISKPKVKHTIRRYVSDLRFIFFADYNTWL